MDLSKKSWHSKLFNLTYGRDNGLPDNLCPYFWKLLLAVIVFVPLSVFFIPVVLISFVANKFSKGKNTELKDEGYLSWMFMVALVVNALILIAFSMVYMWFQPWDFNHLTGFQGCGLTAYLLLIICGIVYLVRHLKEKRRENRMIPKTPKEPKPSIVVEFIKAKYNRYCPKINWK